MDAKSRAAPSPLAHEAEPRRGGGDDAADALGEDGETAGGDVAVLGRRDHLADVPDLICGESMGREARARRFIFEVARFGSTSPCAQPRGREADESEDASEVQDAAGAVDGAQQS